MCWDDSTRQYWWHNLLGVQKHIALCEPSASGVRACLEGPNFALLWSTLPIDVEMVCKDMMLSMQAQPPGLIDECNVGG